MGCLERGTSDANEQSIRGAKAIADVDSSTPAVAAADATAVAADCRANHQPGANNRRDAVPADPSIAAVVAAIDLELL